MILSEAGRVQRLFDERMKRLAAPLSAADRPENTLGVVVFLLGQERYALELAALREIRPFDRCTPLPTAPPEVLGVINVRGDIRAVLSMKRLLALPGSDEDKGYVLFLGEEGRLVGLRVDSISAIQKFPADRITPLSDGRAPASRYLRGWTAEGITLLDAKAFLEWAHQH